MSIGVLVALTGSAAETDALQALGRAGAAAHVVRRCMDIADLLATAATHQAAVALVAIEFRGLDADAVARLADADVVAIGVVDELNSGAHVRLRRMGVAGFVASTELAGVVGVVARILEEKVLAATSMGGSSAAPIAHQATTGPGPSAGDRPRARQQAGRQLAVWGPTGAPGRSTVALGIAAELARRELSTLLVDADVYGGTLAQQLGILDETSGLLATTRAANSGVLTPTELERCARAVDPMLAVLTGLPRADRWPEVRPALLTSVLDTARSWVSWTVVDCGFSIERDEELSYDTTAPRRNGATVAVLEAVDEVVVVGGADPVGLTRLARALTELATALRPERVRVVVNRHRATIGWSPQEIHDVLEKLGRSWELTILPSDPAACDRAVVQGRTLIECASGSRLVQGFADLTSAVTGTSPSTGGRLRRRRAARAR